jgi:hypothetical protein
MSRVKERSEAGVAKRVTPIVGEGWTKCSEQGSELDLSKNRLAAECPRMGRDCRKNIAARDFTRLDR